MDATNITAAPPPTKVKLTVELLRKRGFVSAGEWRAGEGRLTGSCDLPRERGVYAFSINGEVVYVGLASRSLAQRLYFYGKPGVGQRTNVRLNGLITQAIGSGVSVQIHYACPPSLDWNGFTISGPEGLEAGLIQDYYLPWNMKGA